MRRRWVHNWTQLLANLALSASAVVGAVGISWWAHSLASFGYPLLYDALAIDEHIAEYAPQNRYREGFETTSRGKRLALFDRIVSAVNREGEGLAALSYQPSNRAEPVAVLREAEIRHLTAVAGLVTVLHWVAGSGLLVYSITLMTMRWGGVRLWRSPPLIGLGIALALALILAIAALDTRDDGWFAWAHEQLFGANHQWFFHYQESLMTTLLKAPDIFAPMGVSIGLVAVMAASLLYTLALWMLPVEG